MLNSRWNPPVNVVERQPLTVDRAGDFSLCVSIKMCFYKMVSNACHNFLIFCHQIASFVRQQSENQRSNKEKAAYWNKCMHFCLKNWSIIWYIVQANILWFQFLQCEDLLLFSANWVSLGFGLLFGQNKTLKMHWVFFKNIFLNLNRPNYNWLIKYQINQEWKQSPVAALVVLFTYCIEKYIS